MATNYWVGASGTLAQTGTITVTAYDAATTYAVIIGGITVSVVGSGGTTTTVATALTTALNASVYPYFSYITWSSVGAVITATSDVAGMPFTLTTSETGGAGTIGDYVATVANAGPQDWASTGNWSLGAVPVSTNDVVIQDSASQILWGMDQSAVVLNSLTIKKTFTGKIGLNRLSFATNATGTTTTASDTIPYTEYRPIYLSISATTVQIGENFGPSSPAGSGRIMLNLGTDPSTVIIHSTAQTPAETGKQAVRIKADDNATDIFVRSAPGGVGIATDAPGETSTIRKVSVDDLTTNSRVTTGAGVTCTTWYQDGGQNVQQAAATVTTVTVNGGTLQAEGAFTTTTLNQTGGTYYQNATGTAITTANIYGGTLDFTNSNQARTITTLNRFATGIIKGLNSTIITVTNALGLTQGGTIND